MLVFSHFTKTKQQHLWWWIMLSKINSEVLKIFVLCNFTKYMKIDVQMGDYSHLIYQHFARARPSPDFCTSGTTIWRLWINSCNPQVHDFAVRCGLYTWLHHTLCLIQLTCLKSQSLYLILVKVGKRRLCAYVRNRTLF